jgi:hypothetical protein
MMNLALIAEFQFILTFIALNMDRISDSVVVKLSIDVVSSLQGAHMIWMS